MFARFGTFFVRIFTPPRWEEYRDFFQMHFIRYFLGWFSIVPLLYHALQDMPDTICFPLEWTKRVLPGNPPDWPDALVLKLSLPFNWQLLWFSSLFFFIAFALYLLMCPRFVRKYHSYSDYEACGHDPRNLAWQAMDLFNKPGVNKDKFIERMSTKGLLSPTTTSVEKKYVAVTRESSIFYFSHNGKNYEFCAPPMHPHRISYSSPEICGTFWEIFGRYSELYPPIRIIIRALLVFSLVIVVFVTIQHIYSGLIPVLHWFSRQGAAS